MARLDAERLKLPGSKSVSKLVNSEVCQENRLPLPGQPIPVNMWDRDVAILRLDCYAKHTTMTRLTRIEGFTGD
jgi:hypothetical protein